VEEKVKERIFGAVIVLALGVIFVPMAFDKKVSDKVAVDRHIPEAPAWAQSEELLLPSERLSANMTNDAILPPTDNEAQPTTAVPSEDTLPQPITLPAAISNATASMPPSEPAPEPIPEVAPASTPVMKITPVTPAQTSSKKEATHSPLMAYTIQVGTFENHANAKKLAASLREAGYTAYVTDNISAGKVLKRVMVGPSSNRTEAQKTSAKLQQDFKLKTLIVKYDPRD
jgi:DedD protein